MAKLALTVVGGIIGFAIGGPMGAKLGMMLGGMAGSMLFGPSIKGPRLNDLTVTASTYGNVIPELYGTSRMSGNMIWTAGIKEKKKKSGGKGGPKQTTYTYSASFAIAFCKGEIKDVLSIWADGKLIWGGKSPDKGSLSVRDFTELFAAFISKKKKKKKYKFRVYRGTETQEPDSIIEAKEGVGKVPAYRGLCYLVFENMPLEDFGNRIPQLTAEITKTTSRTLPETELIQASPISGSLVRQWNEERFYEIDAAADEVAIYDTRSMREIRRVGGITDAVRKFSITPGGTFLIGETSNNQNSRPLAIYNLQTGEYIGRLGRASLALSEWPLTSGQPYDPSRANLGGAGTLFTFRVLTLLGQMEYLINQGGNTGAWVMYQVPTRMFVYYSGDAKWAYMRGKEAIGESDVLMRRGSGALGVELCVMSVKAGAVGQIVCSEVGTNCTALNSSLVVQEKFQYNPFDDGRHFNVSTWAYDASDNSIIFWARDQNNVGYCVKFLITERMTKWITDFRDYPDMSLTPSSAMPQFDMSTSAINGGKVGWGQSNKLWQINLQNGEFDYRTTYTGPAWTSMSWDSDTQSLSVGYRRLYFRDTANTVSVASIVEDILAKTGVFTPDDYDITALADIPVKGYVISRDASAKDCLQQLAGAYFFDGVESDYKLKIKMRGGAKSGTITEPYLGFVEGKDITVKETRVQELELPMRVTINYSNQERDYQVSSQYAKRLTNPFPTMHSRKEDKFELPIVLSATEAKQIADKTLKMAWANRNSVSNALPWSFLKYDAGDVVDLVMDSGTTYTLRFTKMDIGVDFSIHTEAVTENPTAYVSTVIGDAGSVPVQNPEEGGETNLIVINTPLLRDVDDTQGISSVYYLAGAAYTPGFFSNAYVFESLDGIEYDETSFVTVEATHGYVVEALPPAKDWGALDESTSVTVFLASKEDSLETITEEQLLAGGNAALIGDEVIQFQNAVLNADGSFTISNLLRARRGTNYAVNDHRNNERFILLDPTEIFKLTNPPAEWSLTKYLKSVAPGTLEEDASPMVHKFEPNDLKPYTPEGVTCTDDATNVIVGFIRRSRITAELTDYTSEVPYREGQGVNARFTYDVYVNKSLAAEPWKSPLPADHSGQVLIYKPDGTFNNLEFTFPMAGVNEFVTVIREQGFVPGIPKIVHYSYVSPGQWDMTELY